MPKGSIAHQPERSARNKRHAQPTTAFDLKSLTGAELDQQMDATMRDILALCRRYIRLDRALRERAGHYIDPTLAQLDVMWIVNRAHWDCDLEEIYQRQAKIDGECPL